MVLVYPAFAKKPSTEVRAIDKTPRSLHNKVSALDVPQIAVTRTAVIMEDSDESVE
jgi:hypothetical protein